MLRSPSRTILCTERDHRDRRRGHSILRPTGVQIPAVSKDRCPMPKASSCSNGGAQPAQSLIRRRATFVHCWRSWSRSLQRVFHNAVGRDIVKCCGSPRELGGALLHLSRSAFRFLLHAIDEAHAGTHERQQLRAIHLSPALFGHREQLERHHQRLRA